MSEEYGSDFITLTDEDGKEFELEHLDTLEYDGRVYMAFIPADTPDDEDEVDMIILRAEEEEGEEVLSTIDDEAELERIYNLFIEQLSEEEGLEEDK